MTGTAMVFVFIGVGVTSANLMKIIEWLDTPRTAPRRRSAGRAA